MAKMDRLSDWLSLRTSDGHSASLLSLLQKQLIFTTTNVLLAIDIIGFPPGNRLLKIALSWGGTA